MLKKTKYGWQFKDNNTHYESLIIGIKVELIRPVTSKVYCFLSGHTFEDRGFGVYRCVVCKKIY